MAIVAFALPIMPGQADGVRSFAEELDQLGLRSRYQELNRRAGVRRHMEWIQPGPDGDLRLVVFETDTPQNLGRPFEDDEYDRWWVSRFKELHGFDPAGPGPRPEPTFAWTEPDAEG